MTKQDKNDSVVEGDPRFTMLQSGITLLLKAMQMTGAPMGSVAKVRPPGMGVCVIVATGDSADLWEALHDAWERGELTEGAEDDEEAE